MCDELPKHDIKILPGDVNVKGRETGNKRTIADESLREEWHLTDIPTQECAPDWPCIDVAQTCWKRAATDAPTGLQSFYTDIAYP